MNFGLSKNAVRVLGVLATASVASAVLPEKAEACYDCAVFPEYSYCIYGGITGSACEAGSGHCITYGGGCS